MKNPLKIYAFVLVMFTALSACEVDEGTPTPLNDKGVITNGNSNSGGGGDDEEPIIHLEDSTSTYP
ncbi:MAG: hypothetical protein MI921_06695 [Cytophagales bacterium]|nr:hypothetical protein [Cytophagales bacterium]